MRMSVFLTVRRGLMALMLAGVSLGSVAQTTGQVTDERSFPTNTKRGVLNMSKYPDVIMDGKIRYTVPATRFYDAQNMLILPTYLTGNYIIVNYTDNDFGELQKIWVLTADERKRVLPKPEVWTPMQFKSSNQ
ncbi:hypothetical protein ACO0LM_28305 [Undibacterium sp. Di26W]|uniref:hypothetical protein n=1 Tax=Undibacterium sp. Di26W TaxID=3413035 RepID=UPI003BF14A64